MLVIGQRILSSTHFFYNKEDHLQTNSSQVETRFSKNPVDGNVVWFTFKPYQLEFCAGWKFCSLTPRTPKLNPPHTRRNLRKLACSRPAPVA